MLLELEKLMDTRSLYLDLLKRALTDLLYDPVPEDVRLEGRDWPSRAYTMIGMKRLDNLQYCIEQVLAKNIPGDFIETGVWRGGATIFMRALLKVAGVTNRHIWVADSFEGLPKPDSEQYPADTGDIHHQYQQLAVPIEQVKEHFRRFNLLDDQVNFLQGWFRDTLPTTTIKQLAILRLDGDMYESTMEALVHLYPKLSEDGYIIIDDYGAISACRQAVEDYRASHNIVEAIHWIDWTGVYWQRGGGVNHRTKNTPMQPHEQTTIDAFNADPRSFWLTLHTFCATDLLTPREEPRWRLCMETPKIDVEQVMEQIRENVRKRRQEFPPSKATSSLPTDQDVADLTSLHRNHEIYPLRFISHRRVLGHFVVLAKKLLQQLLTPILERQLAFNTATARLTSSLWKQVAALYQQQETALQALQEQLWGSTAAHRCLAGAAGRDGSIRTGSERCPAGAAGRGGSVGTGQSDALQALRAEVEKGATDREARIVEGERTIAQLRTEGILQDRRITLLLEEARKRLPDAWDQAQLQNVADEGNHVLDALYVSFEDQFRGTRADIKERLSVYLPILQKAPLGSETAPILDVGCGRGEWLEVLQEAGLRGQGVDRNRVLVEQCQQRGLGVVEGDGLAYLRSVPDASLGAVTGFHIIEHLPLEGLIKLLDETVRVLIPGGVAIFETPNPQNVLVGSHNFYLDPTHRNPLPSSVMQFIAEARGLCRVKIIELHPYPVASHVQETHLEVAQRFNEYFYGPQDYGVVGWKA